MYIVAKTIIIKIRLSLSIPMTVSLALTVVKHLNMSEWKNGRRENSPEEDSKQLNNLGCNTYM